MFDRIHLAFRQWQERIETQERISSISLAEDICGLPVHLYSSANSRVDHPDSNSKVESSSQSSTLTVLPSHPVADTVASAVSLGAASSVVLEDVPSKGLMLAEAEGQALSFTKQVTGSTVGAVAATSLSRPLLKHVVTTQANALIGSASIQQQHNNTWMERARANTNYYVSNLYGPGFFSMLGLRLARSGSIIAFTPYPSHWLQQQGMRSGFSDALGTAAVAMGVTLLTAPVDVARKKQLLGSAKSTTHIVSSIFREHRGALKSAIVYGVPREVPFWPLFITMQQRGREWLVVDNDSWLAKQVKIFAITGASASFAASMTYPFDGAMTAGIKANDASVFGKAMSAAWKVGGLKEVVDKAYAGFSTATKLIFLTNGVMMVMVGVGYMAYECVLLPVAKSVMADFRELDRTLDAYHPVRRGGFR